MMMHHTLLVWRVLPAENVVSSYNSNTPLNPFVISLTIIHLSEY